MNYEFKIGRILLPVTPDSYSIPFEKETEIVRCTNVGDVVIPKFKVPESFSLKGIFSVNDYPFVNAKYDSSMDYVKKIKRMIESGKPQRVIIADEDETKVNGRYYLTKIEYGEEGFSNGDINFVIDFKKYTPISLTTAYTAPTAARSTESAPKAPNTYTVKYGDCLWNLSRKFYGTPLKWRVLYEANKPLIGADVNRIMAGWVLTVPKG